MLTVVIGLYCVGLSLMLYWVQGTIWTVNNVCALSMDVIILCCEPERMKRHRKLIGSSVYFIQWSTVRLQLTTVLMEFVFVKYLFTPVTNTNGLVESHKRYFCFNKVIFFSPSEG